MFCGNFICEREREKENGEYVLWNMWFNVVLYVSGAKRGMHTQNWQCTYCMSNPLSSNLQRICAVFCMWIRRFSLFGIVVCVLWRVDGVNVLVFVCGGSSWSVDCSVSTAFIVYTTKYRDEPRFDYIKDTDTASV